MKVSIITVAKNAEDTISCCLQSVVSQSYGDLEHIIIDGGSTDRTFEIINSEIKIRETIIVSKKDLGIYDALNKALALCTGDIVGLLHADDFFKDQYTIQNIVGHFERTNASILHADVAYVERFNIAKVTRVYNSKYFKPWMFRFGVSPAHPTFYVARNLIDKFGNYEIDLDIGGDFEWMMRYLYIHKIKSVYINEVWVMMRLGGLSTSGFACIFKKNKEILMACKRNGVYTNYLLIYSKYLFKWWGLVFKRIKK